MDQREEEEEGPSREKVGWIQIDYSDIGGSRVFVCMHVCGRIWQRWFWLASVKKITHFLKISILLGAGGRGWIDSPSSPYFCLIAATQSSFPNRTVEDSSQKMIGIFFSFPI